MCVCGDGYKCVCVCVWMDGCRCVDGYRCVCVSACVCGWMGIGVCVCVCVSPQLISGLVTPGPSSVFPLGLRLQC